MPSIQGLRECIRALNEDIPEDAFKEPELIGWVYQYFQTEEKDRVFEEVRTKKKKIEGDDIVPATSLYTERYMVDYLIQNSLGAIWMEMYPDSKLCENWPYFVKDQDLKPREAKPVKSLSFLDPACGSGHFLLVAFDFFVQMYEEEARLAFEDKIPKEWLVSREKIPTTILEFNLHGIDIDLRSVQLSYLVFYLRMREYQKSVGAPKLLPTKVNLVVADASLLNTPEFLSWCEERFKEEPYAINIIKGISGRLKNLSEIGSLARPEEDLKELIHREKERLLSAWKREKAPKQFSLFRQMLTPEQQELPFDKVTDDQFWGEVLSQVTRALDEYYKEASERGDTRAQVFAHEASRGFKFLELCNKRYDVVATNPPYMGSGNMGKELKDYVQRVYPEGKRDLYAAFILRNREWATNRGIVAMVTQQSWMFLSKFMKIREKIIQESSIQTIAHLGPRAFAEIGGEVVNCSLFTLENQFISKKHHIIAFRLIAAKSPSEKRILLENATRKFNQSIIFSINQLLFLDLTEYPIVYWLTQRFLDILIEHEQLGRLYNVSRGVDTCDNNRFLRFVWEISERGGRWLKYLKAGGYRRWYGYESRLLDWSENGDGLRRALLKKYSYLDGNCDWLIKTNTFFKHGWTYSLMAQGSLGARCLDGLSICDSASPGIFSESPQYLIGAILNSRLTSYLL